MPTLLHTGCNLPRLLDFPREDQRDDLCILGLVKCLLKGIEFLQPRQHLWIVIRPFQQRGYGLPGQL